MVVVVAGRKVGWVRGDRPTAERGRREASQGRTLPFSGARLPRLPRRRTAQGELTPELTRTAQGWWYWVLGHREFPQSARGAAAVVVVVGGSVVGSAGRWVGWVRADCQTAERGRQAREVRRWPAAAAVVVVVVVVAGVRYAARRLRSASSRCTLRRSARTHETHRPAGPATFSPTSLETWWRRVLAAGGCCGRQWFSVGGGDGGGAVVQVLQVVVLATVGCDGGSSCDGGKVWWW